LLGLLIIALGDLKADMFGFLLDPSSIYFIKSFKSFLSVTFFSSILESFATSGWLRLKTLLEKKSESRLILVVTTLVVIIDALCPKPNPLPPRPYLNGRSFNGI